MAITYCTTTDAKSLNSQAVYDATSKPSLAQLTSFVAGITADMDARMQGVGITVQVSTSPASIVSRNLKFICMHGAASRAEETAFMGGNKNESTHAERLLQYYEDAMQRIEANPSLVQSGADSVFASLETDEPDKARTSEPFPRDEDIR